jgi:class 3 adenylate cyclase
MPSPVDKFTGDGIMAVFAALEHRAVPACLAAVGVQGGTRRHEA